MDESQVNLDKVCRLVFPAIMTDGEEWVPLKGGMLTSVSKKGNIVKRPLGPWSKAVHQFLLYLQSKNFATAPKLLEVTEREEYLSYLEGSPIMRPWPAVVKTVPWMEALGLWLKDYHRICSDFVLEPGLEFIWGPKSKEPDHVVCHGDLGPWNILVHHDQINGVIDWDLAYFGSPLDDLSQLVLEFAPLRAPVPGMAAFSTPAEVLDRVRALCRSYGFSPKDLSQHLVNYLTRTSKEMKMRASRQVPPFAALAQRGIPDDLLKDRDYIQAYWMPHLG